MSRQKDWLKYSEELVEISDLLISNTKYSWACFTLHQAASAALKAILSKQEKSTFDENLIKLIRVIGETLTIPNDVKDACHEMNNHFIKSRNLEGKETGTPLDNYSIKDASTAKENTMIILRFAFHYANV